MVTAERGCHDRLAAGVRYSRAMAWWLANIALASRKLLTTCWGDQPRCGPLTIRPQQAEPAPPIAAGVDCTRPSEGIVAQPLATSVTSAAPATRVRKRESSISIAPHSRHPTVAGAASPSHTIAGAACPSHTTPHAVAGVAHHAAQAARTEPYAIPAGDLFTNSHHLGLIGTERQR